MYTCDQHKLLAANVIQQRRQLPPAVNDSSLFTKASPFGDPKDPFYHSPCNKIGSHFSPHVAAAAALLFEQSPPHSHGRLGSPEKNVTRLSAHLHGKRKAPEFLVRISDCYRSNDLFYSLSLKDCDFREQIPFQK